MVNLLKQGSILVHEQLLCHIAGRIVQLGILALALLPTGLC